MLRRALAVLDENLRKTVRLRLQPNPDGARAASIIVSEIYVSAGVYSGTEILAAGAHQLLHQGATLQEVVGELRNSKEFYARYANNPLGRFVQDLRQICPAHPHLPDGLAQRGGQPTRLLPIFTIPETDPLVDTVITHCSGQIAASLSGLGTLDENSTPDPKRNRLAPAQLRESPRASHRRAHVPTSVTLELPLRVRDLRPTGAVMLAATQKGWKRLGRPQGVSVNVLTRNTHA